MNKILIMCEGPNEKKIMDILLDNNCLVFSHDDLLGRIPFFARQLSSSARVKAELNQYPDKVDIYRAGDCQNENLAIPRDYRDKIGEIRKYCTKPELEMLLIISEGLNGEFEKVKSNLRAKMFAKTYIRLGKKKYDNSTRFYEDYYGKNVAGLVYSIKEYKRIKGRSHNKSELCLADLIDPDWEPKDE